ncbi:hypothetical protein RCL1_004711 [Eukaryota sp. TZLM3-RCL]
MHYGQRSHSYEDHSASLDSPFDEDVELFSESSSSEEALEEQQNASSGFRGFLKGYTVYDVMPDSGKVIVMDPDLSIAQAIGILMHNEITCTPLWDTETNSFFGMFTIWDVVDVLLHGYINAKQTSDWTGEFSYSRDQSLRAWKDTNPKKAITITPTCRLMDALSILRSHSLHRLPVVADDGSVVHVISPRRIAAFLVGKYRKNDDKTLSKTVGQLFSDGIGISDTQKVLTCKKSDLLVDALKKLHENRIASLVVVEEAGNEVKPVDLFNTADLIPLTYGASSLFANMTVDHALQYKLQRREGLHLVCEDFILKKLLQTSAQHRVHRFVVVNSDGFLRGLLSVGDVLKSFSNDDVIPS